jgi:hypothetical protein
MTFNAHRLSRGALIAICALLCAPVLADRAQDIEARYRSERAACDSNPAVRDRAACRREAAAARDAARKGPFGDEQAAYEKNALARCEALPEAERDNCKRRTRGEGETSGSVEGGGILREYRELILPQEGGATGR